jgi:RNA polymerase primary sigma factor
MKTRTKPSKPARATKRRVPKVNAKRLAKVKLLTNGKHLANGKGHPLAVSKAVVAVAAPVENTNGHSVTVAPVEPPVERGRYDHNTAYNLYLTEIGQTKLLTPEEEVVLAKRIKRGDKKAREQMIKANLRLVVKIARDYDGLGLPLLDLINEGNVGLIKGVERFNPAKGAKLSTYAAWWIKQAIKRALANQSKTIRLPVHVVDKLFHMRRAAVKLQEELGREPTTEELAGELNISARKLAMYQASAIRPTSLDAPLGDDDDSNKVADVVADDRAGSPFDDLRQKTDTAMIREVIEILEPREREILRHRFNLDGEGEKTLEELGAMFGVTRERIRQLQNIALHKLRRRIEKMDTISMAA